MIIRDSEFLNEDGSIPFTLLKNCIEEHQAIVKGRYEKLKDYYDGNHAIKNRKFESEYLPNNKIVCNHAKYISDMVCGYVFGTPIQYNGENTEELNELYTMIDEDSHNAELGIDLSVYGTALEVIYMSDEEQPVPMLGILDNRNSFVVHGSDTGNKPLFAVSYKEKCNINNEFSHYEIKVYTKQMNYTYISKVLCNTSYELKEEEPNYSGKLQVVEYRNNKEGRGDFESVIELIDAYNVLQSDRVNDKEQVVDALLAVTGVSFGDTEEETSKTAKLLKKHKILELPEGGAAQWLTKGLNETEIEVLKKSLKDDIHEFSKVPCLSDENFIGNSSGVAIKYKLIALETLGMTKERYFKKGLRERLAVTNELYSLKGKNMDLQNIDIVMNRTLPVDEETQAKIAMETDGLLSLETRIKRFDAEINVETEIEKLTGEEEKRIDAQQRSFGSYGLTGSDE